MDGLFSIGEMAHRLGVAIVTLRRWDREGRLIARFCMHVCLRTTRKMISSVKRHG
jgi:predicted site-specific integrase-resolvase